MEKDVLKRLVRGQEIGREWIKKAQEGLGLVHSPMFSGKSLTDEDRT